MKAEGLSPKSEVRNSDLYRVLNRSENPRFQAIRLRSPKSEFRAVAVIENKTLKRGLINQGSSQHAQLCQANGLGAYQPGVTPRVAVRTKCFRPERAEETGALLRPYRAPSP